MPPSNDRDRSRRQSQVVADVSDSRLVKALLA
jgi:hypothetical protein